MLGQVRPGKVSLCQVRTGYFSLGWLIQVVSLFQVKTC
jgi:hypothetical protein